MKNRDSGKIKRTPQVYGIRIQEIRKCTYIPTYVKRMFNVKNMSFFGGVGGERKDIGEVESGVGKDYRIGSGACREYRLGIREYGVKSGV